MYFSFVIYWVYGVYHITIEKVSGYPDTFFGDKKVQLISIKYKIDVYGVLWGNVYEMFGVNKT